MSVRCKFQLNSLEPNGNGKRVNFTTLYDPDASEDSKFSLATPWGELNANIDNPKALEQLEVGKQYYVDITPAE